MSLLAKSILKTLTYFDVQDMPLSLMEIQNYLGVKASAFEIMTCLETELSEKIRQEQGFYFLAGREGQVQKRKRKYRISLQRFRKARKYLYWARHIPFVRGVAVSGSQAVLNSRVSSDIDLFIITAKKRIWLARTLVTFFFQITGQRRHGKYTEKRFCLNHYIEEGAYLDQDHNLYTAQLYSSFVPAFGGRYFRSFYEKNNWSREFLPEALPEGQSRFFSYEPGSARRMLEFILEITLMARMLNALSHWYQKSRIEVQDHILVSDQELSFHPDSKGQRILAKFKEEKALLGLDKLG